LEENRISYHESVREVYQRIKRDNMSNIWDRYEAQGLGGNLFVASRPTFKDDMKRFLSYLIRRVESLPIDLLRTPITL